MQCRFYKFDKILTPFAKIPSSVLTLSSMYFKINRSLVKRVLRRQSFHYDVTRWIFSILHHDKMSKFRTWPESEMLIFLLIRSEYFIIVFLVTASFAMLCNQLWWSWFTYKIFRAQYTSYELGLFDARTQHRHKSRGNALLGSYFWAKTKVNPWRGITANRLIWNLRKKEKSSSVMFRVIKYILLSNPHSFDTRQKLSFNQQFFCFTKIKLRKVMFFFLIWLKLWLVAFVVDGLFCWCVENVTWSRVRFETHRQHQNRCNCSAILKF